VQRRLRAAWVEPDPAKAKAALEALARSLAHKPTRCCGIAREGLSDTLTLTRLGIAGSCGETLESTNPMESMVDIVKTTATG